ncbi:hypothetical protein JXR93_13575 [bacterium]|nr:hypothetical protein [bacterium]
MTRYIYIILLSTLLSISIQAQEESDSSFKFTSFVSLQTDYNSNFFRATEGEISTISLMVLPGLKLSNKNQSSNEIKFDISGNYTYFASLTDSTSDVVSNNNDFNLTSNLALAFFKQGNFQIFIDDSFNKTSYAGYQDSINKIQNRLSAGFFTTPFGKTLKFSLKYMFSINKTVFSDSLEDQTKAATEAQDNMGHDFSLGIEWRFLPKTSFILEGLVGFVTHTNTEYSEFFSTSDSMPIIGRTGLLGVITPKLAVKLTLGWAYTDYTTGADFNSYVATIEGTYAFSKRDKIVAGYDRGFTDIVFSNYLEYHELYFNYKSSFMNYFEFGASVNFTLNIFSNVSMPAGSNNVTASSSRSEILAKFSPFFGYNYKNQYKAELRYTLNKNITDFTTSYTSETGPTTVNYDYLQHVVTLNFSIFF